MTATAQRRSLFQSAAEAADELLGELSSVEKALDPLNPRDFDAIVRSLGRSLRGATSRYDEASLERALALLDIHWGNLSQEARARVIRAAGSALEAAHAKVLPVVDEVLEVEGTAIVRRTRQSVVRRLRLHISTSLSQRDERAVRFARESQSSFVRDEYGRRRDVFSERARSIVAHGLEQGLGRDDIASELASALEAQSLNRSKNYWEVVSGIFGNRARTNTQLNAFDEASIQRYRFDAVLDEDTSEVCRLIHGRVFSVEQAVRKVREVETLSDPERIRDLQPFIQVGADDSGNQVLFYERSGRRRAVAEVLEPGLGRRDEVGRYGRALSTAELEAAGLSVPPLHGRCRSTIVAEV